MEARPYIEQLKIPGRKIIGIESPNKFAYEYDDTFSFILPLAHQQVI